MTDPDDPRVRRNHRAEWERFEAEWRRRYRVFWLWTAPFVLIVAGAIAWGVTR